jgi:hypothetical protein
VKKVLSFALLAVATASTAIAAVGMTTWNMNVIHVEAREIGAFNGGKGVDVPKVYVLDQSGQITYENDPDKKESSQAVVAALRHSTPIASKDQKILTDLLKAHNYDPARMPTKTLVTLEFGDSVGRCVACDRFYPGVQTDISSAGLPSFTWVHVKLEKNGYRQ